MLNEEMKDIINIVNYLYDSGLLKKGITQTCFLNSTQKHI